jgi:hypothetical protein
VIEGGDEECPVFHELGDVVDVLEVVGEPLFGVAFEERASKHDLGCLGAI